ncbi:cache domain-containing protein [Sabulicella rubraurantiaca]|uniref:cache domain-containing protein n=1 Tax=Sabulicella rubraurantiaca TaxID=2811429 RepID=UPI001A96A73E|nr:cache domain-containing protein [Sabulicella rubraurantiaca]
MSQNSRRSTFGLLASFAVAAAALPVLAGLFGLLNASSGQVERRNIEVLDAAAQQVTGRLSRGLSEQWRELRAMGDYALGELESGVLRLRLDTAKTLNDRLSWMGVVRPDGRVIAATGRMLEGQDVSARPWFVAGLSGLFAGDVHEAQLLARLLPRPPGAEPLRLIDFAAPLRRADGSVAAVIGSHVDWAWVRDVIGSAPLPPGTEALLLARDGTVLVGPAGLEGTRLMQRSAMVGPQAVGVTTEEEWPDGQRYLARIIAAANGAGIPSFGWSVVVRQPTVAATALERVVARQVLVPLAAASLSILVVGLLIARTVGRPFATLASAAAALAEGRRLDAPLPRLRQTRESEAISAALSRFDGQQAEPVAAPHALKDAA